MTWSYSTSCPRCQPAACVPSACAHDPQFTCISAPIVTQVIADTIMQVGADIEMALCMARALAGHPADGRLPVADLIREYVAWSQPPSGFAPPAGHGQTIRRALKIMQHGLREGNSPQQMLADIAKGTAAEEERTGMPACSNGALMRALPLAIWGHLLPTSQLAACARQEAALTHPSSQPGCAVAAYDVAIAHLIRCPGDGAGALQAATTWADALPDNSAVQSWLREAAGMTDLRGEEGLYSVEWAKWPFQLAFMHLRLGTGYEAGLRATLATGGEPSTNAAIVGGMLGALHGANAVPEQLIAAARDCRVGSRGLPQQDHMRAKEIPECARLLLQRAHGGVPV